MPGTNFFASLGLFVRGNFLDAESCAKVRADARGSRHLPAAVVDEEADGKLKEGVRRTTEAKVSPPTVELVRGRLAALKPCLERHFEMTLKGFEPPQFLIYRRGDFFSAHRDGDTEPGKPDYVKERRVSLTVFLNGGVGCPDTESYGGGELIFYGLMKERPWEKVGFPLTGEAGLAVAFRSNVFHEVAAVTEGERYTIVSWFY
jgi:predicted 2-oxoglutarate/Fe(II)-dependent dioxygenase YbiX